jgi:hypothetical protein
MGNLAFVNEAGGLQSSCLMSRPPSAVADRRFVAFAHLSKNSRLVRETVVHHAARDLCGRISLQEPKFKRCIGITSSRRAPGGKPEDTLPLRCRGFFFGRLNQMAQPQAPDFDRDEVIVCTLIAFCIGNFTLETIYRLFG